MIDELFRAALYLTKDRSEAEDLVVAAMRRASRSATGSRHGADRLTDLHALLHRVWHERGSVATLRRLEAMSPRQVQCALMALPEVVRMTVYYADVEALPNDQIAEIMKVDVSAVISRLDDGRRLLRAKINQIANRKGAKSMAPPPVPAGIIRRLAEGTQFPALDVFGPRVEILTLADDAANSVCVMRAVIPPGVTVPLHRHDDLEDFYVLAGEHQVLVEVDGRPEWRDARAGDYIKVPGTVPHAHRNVSDRPAVDLIITTPKLGRFFQEIGRPAGAPRPSPEEVAHFVETAIRYGYRLGTPEENAAVGIELPTFNA